MKKVQVKLTIPATMKQDLENVAALTADSIQTIIKGYVRDALYVPKQGPPQSPPPRAHRVAGSKYSKDKIQPKKEATAASGVPLPADFAPPESIARNARLDHAKTLAAFRNLHLSNSTRYEDWEVAYRYFCNETAQKPKYAHLHAAQPSTKRFDKCMRETETT